MIIANAILSMYIRIFIILLLFLVFSIFFHNNGEMPSLPPFSSILFLFYFLFPAIQSFLILSVFSCQSTQKNPCRYTDREYRYMYRLHLSLMNLVTPWHTDYKSTVKCRLRYCRDSPCLGFSPNDSSIITVITNCTLALNAIQLTHSP